jgi:hypothetical protein
MFISVEFITGMMLGFELVDKRMLGEESGYVVVIDLFIIRLMIDN